MRISYKFALATLTAIALVSGCGRATVPLVNYNDVTFIAPKKLTLAQVKKAITAAAEVKGWQVDDKGPGKMSATLTVRHKHTVVVLITYTTSSFSINYVDSVDMKYGTRDGEPSIHPAYNEWVKELEQTIEIEIKALS